MQNDNHNSAKQMFVRIGSGVFAGALLFVGLKHILNGRRVQEYGKIEQVLSEVVI